MVKQDFLPSSYFNLTGFAHRSLFFMNEPVWETVKNIHKYLTSSNLEPILSEVPRGTFLVNPEQISIGANTEIEPGAFIMGPCIIGNRCKIRHGAYIRGNVVIGDDCVVGHTTEIKNSILLNAAHAAHFAYIGDSILGCNVNIGAGVKFANLKLNKKEIFIFAQGVKVATGMHKLGAIVGDNVQLGCNVVTNPGTLIGPSSACFPNLTIGGVIPPGKTLRPAHAALLS